MFNRVFTRRRGFSLVEMLTVIAIIALLIAILVPAIAQVQKQAKATGSKSTLGAMETALASFSADGRVGGGYPPSMPYYPNQTPAQVMNPYSSSTAYPPDKFYITGAGLLVWALAGADRLGCPGFVPTRTTNDPNAGWYSDTDAIAGPSNSQPVMTQSGAYSMYNKNAYSAANAGSPVFPRSGPFVDMSKVKITDWDPKMPCVPFNGGSASAVGNYVVPLEVSNCKDLGLPGPPQRKYPMFIDSFGAPILYWKADPSSQRMTEYMPTQQINVSMKARASYYFRDNSSLLDPTFGIRDEDVLRTVPTTAAKPHSLRYDPKDYGSLSESPVPRGWEVYIQDKNITAKRTAQRSDSYLLISAGPDGIYGTADDICNFPANGAECNLTAKQFPP